MYDRGISSYLLKITCVIANIDSNKDASWKACGNLEIEPVVSTFFRRVIISP